MGISKQKTAMTDERLGTEPIGSLMLKMGMPAVAAQVINLLYNIIDRIYIGHIKEVGATALTGIGLSIPVVVLLAAFASLVGGGGAPLASISLGRGERGRAEKIVGNSLTLICGLAVVLFLVFYAVKEPLLYAIGASNETFVYANDYLKIYLCGTLFTMITVGMNGYISAQGRAGIAMLSTLIGAVLNIGLDPLFIFGLNMGVKGAALATVLSQGVSACWIVGFLASKHATLRITRGGLVPDRTVIGQMLALGIAPFVMTATESFISIVMNSGLQKYGGDLYVGALTVAQSVMQLMTVPINGFGQGATPVISYNFGAGNVERVKEAFRKLFIILMSYSTGFAAIVMLFPKPFTSMFTDDAELVELSTKVVPVFVAGMLIFGIQRACQTTFLALGQARTSTFIALLRKVILLIPLALILPHFLGVMGIYMAEPIADATAALTCGTIFLIRFPKILKNVG